MLNSQLSFESFNYLSSLYPADISAKTSLSTLKTKINNYILITKISLKALQHLQKGDLTFSDALVGDTACHIRGAMFCDLINQNKLMNQIDFYKSTIQNVQNELKKLQLSDSRIVESLKNILAVNKIDIQLPKFIICAILAYVLTITKTSKFTLNLKSENKIELVAEEDHQQRSLSIIKKGKVTSTFANHLTKLAKRQLSLYSVHYVQDLAAIINELSLINFVQEDYVKKNDLGLSFLSCYVTIEILLKSAISKKTPLILNVQKINPEKPDLTDYLRILYEYSPKNQKYEAFRSSSIPNSLEAPSPTSAAMVMEAFRVEHQSSEDLFKIITSKDLVEDIILPFFAKHPQYPDSSEETTHYPFMDAKFKDLKERAVTLGVCKDNPTLCCLYHIYADTIQQQFFGNQQSFLERKNAKINIINKPSMEPSETENFLMIS